MNKRFFFPALLALCLVAWCGDKVYGQDASSLATEIAAVQREIRSTEVENDRYAGGLIKSLLVARIAILRQTEAMLQQKSKASTFGISLKYTIDGHPFSPPAAASDLLRSVEKDISENQSKIAKQEEETARYSGGLVQAMSLSTLAILRQTQAMLDQKRVSLRYGLPQYLGFHRESDKPPASSTSGSRPETAVSSDDKNWQIVSIDARVTESNNTWSRYAWRLTLRNESDQPQLFRGTIEFQDSDGFIVDTANTRDMLVAASSEQVFTGFALIQAESVPKVAKTIAKIGKSR